VPDLKTRLVNCFTAVFPALPARDVELASPSTVSEWDSIATVNLVAVIEEEFGIQLGVDDLEQLDSFTRIEQLVTSHLS
jgi:acyl carrier protein